MKCPCGSQNEYSNCCGPIIEGTSQADSPEALMRSRYTAYTQANTDYIAASQSGPAAKDFNTSASKLWAEKVKWQNLQVFANETDNDIGFVCFKANIVYNEQAGCIFEKSEFRKINDKWYYYDSVEIKRNDPCPCGSGKKYKKCCIE